MPVCKLGDTVKVHYTGTDDAGVQFDSSRGRDPISFTIGQGRVIPGFEQGVLGMSVRETKTVVIPPEQAYGPRQEQLVIRVPRSQIPPNITPKVGDRVPMQSNTGQVIPATITAVDADSVTVDANMPLAGKTLTFELELLEIKPATD